MLPDQQCIALNSARLISLLLTFSPFTVDMSAWSDLVAAQNKCSRAMLCSAGARYPLMAERYSTCTADLEEKGWTVQLIANGFDSAVPTVWLVEGLIMYLSYEAADALLRELQSVSAPQSHLLIMVGTSFLCIQVHTCHFLYLFMHIRLHCDCLHFA